jgi:hypothetical protein
MNLKFIPWLLVLGLVIGVIALYASNQNQAKEIAQLQQASQELERVRASLSDTNSGSAKAENEELTRLREDNKDLLRLRNDVRRLREENQQLKTQAQTAQAQAQNAQAQAENFQRNAAQATAQAQQAETTAKMQLQANACINNLRMIDGAKQQFALERQKLSVSPVNPADILPYLRGNVMPACPAGGVYTINMVAMPPTCSVPGHALPKSP